FVVDEDLAPIGVVESIEDVHHGGLARAVLAQQSVDLTRFDGEIDVVVGHERPEHLGHPAKLEFHCSRFSSQTRKLQGRRSRPCSLTYALIWACSRTRRSGFRR